LTVDFIFSFLGRVLD